MPHAPVRFTNLFGVAPAEEMTAGILVVASGAALRRDLDRLDDLLRAMRWPLVGVVENTNRRTAKVSL
jgi:Mrp family chromosome partitioning ATPase